MWRPIETRQQDDQACQPKKTVPDLGAGQRRTGEDCGLGSRIRGGMKAGSAVVEEWAESRKRRAFARGDALAQA
ncbi:hypothetical protein ACQP1W_29005 [Spirillospora sp. CA-255316]